MHVTNQEISFQSKGHSTKGSKIPFISNLKKPECACKQDVLELATLRQLMNISLQTYLFFIQSSLQNIVRKSQSKKQMKQTVSRLALKFYQFFFFLIRIGADSFIIFCEYILFGQEPKNFPNLSGPYVRDLLSQKKYKSFASNCRETFQGFQMSPDYTKNKYVRSEMSWQYILQVGL